MAPPHDNRQDQAEGVQTHDHHLNSNNFKAADSKAVVNREIQMTLTTPIPMTMRATGDRQEIHQGDFLTTEKEEEDNDLTTAAAAGSRMGRTR
jgi:hypothetical protein